MKKSPKVLLLTSRCSVNSDSLAPPLGLYRLKHHLKKNGIDCDVFDLQLHLEQECVSRIEQGMYDIIGVGVTHWEMLSDLDFLWKLRRASKKSGSEVLYIAGGQVASQNCSQWLKCGFDLIVLGYGEATLLNICNRFIVGQKLPVWEMFHGLDGISFLNQNGEVIYNTSIPLSKSDFEKLSFLQDMEMDIPYYEYWDYISRRATPTLRMNKRSYVIENARLYTSSHCLANCGYCSSSASFLRTSQQSNIPFLMLSAQQIHKLLVHNFKKYGAMSFSINDEDFLLGNKVGINRVIDLCKMIVESKKKGELPEEMKFSCQTRVRNFIIQHPEQGRMLNHQIMESLSLAGFHNISLGVETFSDRLLRSPSINKGDVTSSDIHAVLEAIMKHGLYPTINLILAIPESTPYDLINTIQQTLNYLQKPCQVSVANLMLSFPGAPLWNSKDYLTTNKIWIHPETNERILIPYYYTPHDETLATLFIQLETAVYNELETFKVAEGWDNSRLLPRTIIALSTFIAISKILGEFDLLDEIKNLRKSMLR